MREHTEPEPVDLSKPRDFVAKVLDQSATGPTLRESPQTDAVTEAIAQTATLAPTRKAPELTPHQEAKNEN